MDAAEIIYIDFHINFEHENIENRIYISFKKSGHAKRHDRIFLETRLIRNLLRFLSFPASLQAEPFLFVPIKRIMIALSIASSDSQTCRHNFVPVGKQQIYFKTEIFYLCVLREVLGRKGEGNRRPRLERDIFFPA